MAQQLEAAVGANIARLRGTRTQASLGADLKDYLGAEWTRQAVSAAEKGKRSFTAAELVALAQALNTSIPELLRVSESVRVGDRILDPELLRSLVSTPGSPGAEGWTRFTAALDDLNDARAASDNYVLAIEYVRVRVRASDDLRERVRQFGALATAKVRRELESWAARHGNVNEETGEPLIIDEAWVEANATPAMVAARDALGGHSLARSRWNPDIDPDSVEDTEMIDGLLEVFERAAGDES